MFSVLIVEDNKIFRSLLRDTLASRFPSISIFEAADNAEAMRNVEDHLPELILMDIQLAGENGLKAIPKIKAKSPEITIAVLTSYNLPEYLEAARDYGADYFFIKGLTTQEDIIGLVKSSLSAQGLEFLDDQQIPS